MNSMPSNPTISIVTRSPGLDTAAIDAIVTVPTFRRPEQVLETMESLRAQKTKRRFAVIVMENEAEKREGATSVTPMFERGDLTGMVIIAHKRGNCQAYNAGWETAVKYFPNFKHLLVIDDDEIADPNWLEQMCSTAERFGVDVVGGPQLPVFADPKHAAWAKHPIFTPHYDTTGVVPVLYSSGNLLVSHKVLTVMEPPYFDIKFNFMGGGDSDLLSRIIQKGFKLAWCQEGIVSELVPARRVESDWIRARSLRNGVISTLVEKRKRAGTPFGQVRVVAKSLALLVASAPRGLLKFIKTGSVSIGLYPVYIAIGRILAEFGYANEQYREPEKN